MQVKKSKEICYDLLTKSSFLGGSGIFLTEYRSFVQNMYIVETTSRMLHVAQLFNIPIYFNNIYILALNYTPAYKHSTHYIGYTHSTHYTGHTH